MKCAHEAVELFIAESKWNEKKDTVKIWRDDGVDESEKNKEKERSNWSNVV